MEKILGIDYGQKKIGISLSAGNLALPWKTIKSLGSRKELIKQISEIIVAEDIKKAVVGLPVSLSGQMNEQQKTIQGFIDDLKRKLQIPVVSFPEAFSSQQAQKQINHSQDDSQAAANILQGYLDSQV